MSSTDTNVSHHERSLLSALLSGRVPFVDIETIVHPDDFVGDCHSSLMYCLRDIAQSDVPLALSTIEAEMRSRGILEPFGGRDVLRLWAEEGRSTSRAATYHAQNVAGAAKRRRLRSLLLDAAEDIQGDRPIESICAGVSAGIADLQQVDQGDYYSAGEAADAAFSEICAAWQAKGQLGLLSGLRDLDAHLGGFRPGQMIVLAARPSIGKSCVGAEIAQRVSERGETVLFANLEMSKAEMGSRFLSRLAGIPSNELRDPKRLDERDIDKLKQVKDRIDQFPLILWGGRGRSTNQLAAAARRFHARAPLALLVIDYLGLVQGPGKDRYQQVSAVSQAIKSLAMELQIPVLTLCQLNRNSEKDNREPSLADLRDSGAIEQDSDICIFIVRDRDQEDCKLKIGKHRNGALGTIQVRFEGAYSRVSDLEWYHHSSG